MLDVDGAKHPVSVLICYEDILPRFTNDAVRHADPELLVNMTNDAWFGDTSEPWEHLALAQLRAVEHRRYLVRGTNSGVSAVVDPVGRVVAHSGTFRQEAISGADPLDAAAYRVRAHRRLAMAAGVDCARGRRVPQAHAILRVRAPSAA